MVTHVWSIPGVRLLFDIIDNVTRQKLTDTTSVASLFDTLNVWSSIAEHREKIGPSLRALGESKLPTATVLIAHLEALSLGNFVNAYTETSLRTHLMVADALTKSLPSPAHIKHREIMLGHVPFSFAARTQRRCVGGGG